MDDFGRLDLAVGRVVDVEAFPEARVPAYRLTIDLGERGTRRSSAQVTHYRPDELLGADVVCVLGLAPKRIAGFTSEVLVLGALSPSRGVVLLAPREAVEPGTPIA